MPALFNGAGFFVRLRLIMSLFLFFIVIQFPNQFYNTFHFMGG